jgi:hypothetical protein
MMPIRAFALSAAVVLAGTPLLAQPEGDKARLDDFAITSASANSAAVVQVSEAPALDRSETPAPDRDVSVRELPGRPAAKGHLQQIAPAESAASPDQVTRAEAERGRPVAPISSPAEGKPTPVTRLTGRDACDPQSEAARRDPRCHEILELRSSEFNATEAPRLSAEQKLLIQQERRNWTIANNPEKASKLFANPGDVSTQELAATVMNRDAGVQASPKPETVSPPPADLAETLQAVIGQLTLPPQN